MTMAAETSIRASHREQENGKRADEKKKEAKSADLDWCNEAKLWICWVSESRIDESAERLSEEERRRPQSWISGNTS
jgi:hypothetical protein